VGVGMAQTNNQIMIVEVDSDCNITYFDGNTMPCRERPAFTFCECGTGYGKDRGCPKYNYYHRPIGNFNLAFYTIGDIRDAEEKSRRIAGHDVIESRLEQMTNMGWDRILWFKMSESERDIIREFCGIKPRFGVMV
jgi:hypothetical protein